MKRINWLLGKLGIALKSEVQVWKDYSGMLEAFIAQGDPLAVSGVSETVERLVAVDVNRTNCRVVLLTNGCAMDVPTKDQILVRPYAENYHVTLARNHE